MANHTQTGSISFEAVGGFSSYASGQFTTTEDVAQMAQPNLSPYFSHPLTDVYDADENPNGYWKENRTDFWTNLTDGWGHVERVNSGSSGAWCNFYVSPVPNGLKPDTEYTFLVEWRNAVISGTGPQIAPTTVFASLPDCFVGTAYSPRITDGSEGSEAIAVTTIADLSQAVVFSRGYISMPAGSSMSMDVRISFYEGDYSGPYKPYVDQSLITRVSTAETAIEQNAEAITLRATKTEAQQMAQPNLAPITAAPLDSVYNATTNPNGYWKTTPASWFTKLEDGWVHVERDNTEGTGAANTTTWRPRPAEGIVAGGVYTILTEIRNNHSTVSTVGSYDIYLQQQNNNQFWGNVEQVVPGSPDGGTSTTTTVNLGRCGETYVLRSYRLADAEHLSGDPAELFRYNFRLPKGCKFDFDIRQSVYEGIYDGPYKPYTGTQLYASQAQLKVANDQIDLRVEKSGVIAAINASTEAEGGSAVKISADKVQIDGTTTFTSGTTLADYVEGKAQDAADSVVVGGRNLLWNTAALPLNWATSKCTLTEGQADPFGGTKAVLVTPSASDHYFVYRWANHGMPKHPANGYGGGDFTFSVWLKAASTASVALNMRSVNSGKHMVTFDVTDVWQRYEVTGTVADNITNNDVVWVGQAGTDAYYVAYPKMEVGNRATDWSPAPEDQAAYVDSSIDSIQIGGRNLLRWTGKPECTGVTYSSSIAADECTGWYVYGTRGTYTRTDDGIKVTMKTSGNSSGFAIPFAHDGSIADGDVVTLSFDYRGTMTNTGRLYVLCRETPNSYWSPMTLTSDGTWAHFEATLDTADLNTALGDRVACALLIPYLNTASVWLEIRDGSMKLEKGNKATGWSPAPEDVDSSIDGISIGGRNLLLGTADWSKWTDDAGTTISGDEATYTANNTNNRLAPFAVTPGETYTISVDIKADAEYTYGTTGNTFLLLDYSEAGGYHRVTSVLIFYGTKLTTEWQRVSETFIVPTTATIAQLYVSLRNAGTNPPTYTLRHMKVEKGNRPTEWTPAPEDVTSRTQRIYYRTSSSTAPTSQYMPTAWVTETGDKWAANSTTVANWTAKATKLTNGSGTKYPYLFTCEQRQMGDGTLAYTTVLLDETTTVIDGGTIITGSVHANSLDADSVKANIVQTTDLSATKITSGDIATDRMSANIVNAVKAKVSDLYALVAKIGGFVINATSIFSGTAVTSNADNSIALSTADFTRTINSTSRAGLRFAIGDKFGVTGDGTLYANGANITNINAGNISSGSITADRIKANVISAVNNGTGTISADKVNVSAITIGQSQVTNLTTDLGNKANSSDLTAETSKRKATYGTCSTAAGTADKVVTCANFELYAGAAVTVTFSTANTAVVPKLNVNSTGAVAVWYNNAAASNDNPVLWGANATLTFVYDGSHWVLDEKPPTYAVACSTAAATRDKAATVTGALVVNGTTVAVSFSTANTYVAASLGFNLSGTGDDVIRVDGAVTSASNTFMWAANTTLTLVRRGLCWDVTGNDQASKTATTYLTEGTSNGLMVHRSNNATTGVKITDDVDIVRNGSVMTKVDENGMTLYDGNGTADGNVVAKFSEDLVELGKGSEDAIIKLCDGTGQISLNRLTSDTAWLELMSIYWLKLKGVDSSIELGDEFIYEQGGQTYYAGNVHIESRYNSGERVAEIWLNAEGRDGQTSSIDMYADNINLNGTLTLSTPLADSNLPIKDSAGTAGTDDATSGATLAVPYITTDAYGRVIAKGTHTHTIGSLAASAVTTGTFNAARIPNLNASKITAGTLNSARLPTVPINKGGTGQTGVTTVTDVASFIAAASGVTISSVRVTVWGKLVHAYVTAKPDAAKTSAWVVGTVVDAYRPNAVVTGKPYYTGVDSARIMTDGTMQITACGAHEVGVSFTYLLA